ncbi:MAG: XdhC family protein [Pseudomonadota bacterium]
MFAPNAADTLAAPANPDVEAFQRGWDGATPYAVATVVETAGLTAAKAGARAVVTVDGEVFGFAGGGCLLGALKKAGAAAIAAGEPRLVSVRPSDAPGGDTVGESYASQCPSRGEVRLFIEPVAPRPSLFVFGDGALAHWVREMGRAVGLNSQIAEDFAWDDESADRALATGFVVVATQGRGDKAALERAMASACPDVFFVASQKKSAHWRMKLSAAGLSDASLNRLHAPAGLDIGAREPAEIAVTIVAQIIERRRGPRNGDREGRL